MAEFPGRGGRRTRSPRRRFVFASAAVAGMLLTLLAMPTSPASAATGNVVVTVDVPGGWAASGPEGSQVTVLSSGADTAAAMRYSMNPAGLSTTQNFSFIQPTSHLAPPPEGPYQVDVPYTLQGYHGYFDVRVGLEMIYTDTDGNEYELDEAPLENRYAPQCCDSPSGGFTYGGTAHFVIPRTAAGYGFRISGSNYDSDNQLTGTLTLDTKPFTDPAIGSPQDNRQWTGAKDLADPVAAADRTIRQSGEARWFKFQVLPGQHVSATLGNLPQDYDLALYGDIGDAFTSLQNEADLTKLAAGASSTLTGTGGQVPDYPDQLTTIPDKATPPPSGTQFAPRVYAPRVYAPRVYAPRVYAPRVYAPRVYAGDSYDPNVVTNDGFRAAFTAAQTQTLKSVSAREGRGQEVVSADTGNTTGFFYLRVQGHGDSDFDPSQAFTLTASNGDGSEACKDVHPSTEPETLTYAGGSPSTTETVIVTDTGDLGLDLSDARRATYLAKLQVLADATQGVVVDVAQSERVQDLELQADTETSCPYAVNLAALAIKDIIDSYRGPSSKYVVIAGGDEVIPFFRYPDVSGLGQESEFEPPLLPGSTAGASLLKDQVLSQDAYGSRGNITISGTTMPVPDLAVGRLVKTPDEIESTIDHFVANGQVEDLPTPTTSLATGYDFLADAAHRVDEEFNALLDKPENDPDADQLIEEYGVPHDESWGADDLRAKLFDSHHDLVFIGGHFSANDTLAADFDGTVGADELAFPVNEGAFTDSLVLSPGCHSGYNIVDRAGVYDGPTQTNPNDWTQRFAQQHAVLIGGTGYQYGDTDFLEYSERLYLGVARVLREGRSGAAVPIGTALVKAKQDYLAGVASLTGIDQKAVLEAATYGLPMTGVDAPGRTGGADAGRAGLLAPLAALASTPSPVQTGPGSQLGLETADHDVATGLFADGALASGVRGEKPTGSGGDFSWLNGPDGVVVTPGQPALPKVVEDVSAPGAVLMGVGFRGGSYTDTNGLIPLTGAPSTQGNTVHVGFQSDTFFPHQLTNVNYFDALFAPDGTSGRTSLISTPAQYRSPDGETSTERAYDDLGVRLFYNRKQQDGSYTFGSNQPVQAVAPAISDVTGVVQNGTITFSAHATGDLSAGIQEVWVTYTTGPGANHKGTWVSLDLVQDDIDPTLWTATLPLPDGARSSMRFLVQAANGVGAVSMDSADGDGYGLQDFVADKSKVFLSVTSPSSPDAPGIAALVTDAQGGNLAGRAVHFVLSQGGTTVYESVGTSNNQGIATMGFVPGVKPAIGSYQLRVDLLPVTGGSDPVDSKTGPVVIGDPSKVALNLPTIVTPSSPGFSATVTNGDSLVPSRKVRFTLSRTGATSIVATATTAATGVATPTYAQDLPVGAWTLKAELLSQDELTVVHSVQQTIQVSANTLTLNPATAYARAGQSFGTFTATLRDARGALLTGKTVTFSVPTSGASGSFPGTSASQVAKTTVNGLASTALTAKATVGTFAMTVTGPGGATATVQLASQYGFSKFVSPVVNNGGTTTSGANSTTPVKVSALEANGAKVTDAVGAALASAQRVRICWTKTAGNGGGANASTSPVFMKYDASKDFFQSDLKASTMGWKKGNTYKVVVKIVPSSTSTLDLGSTWFLVKIT